MHQKYSRVGSKLKCAKLAPQQQNNCIARGPRLLFANADSATVVFSRTIAKALLPLAELPLQSIDSAQGTARLLGLMADFLEAAEQPLDIESFVHHFQRCLSTLQVRRMFCVLHHEAVHLSSCDGSDLQFNLSDDALCASFCFSNACAIR